MSDDKPVVRVQPATYQPSKAELGACAAERSARQS